MKTDEKLDTYIELIKRYARVALKKVKKPSDCDLDDLTHEGVVIFLLSKPLYSENRGASFRTFLTRRLRNRFAELVKKTYRNKETSGFPFMINNHDNTCFRELDFINKKTVDTFEIVQALFLIESFSDSELEYVNAVLSFTHKHRKSRRKAAREALGISHEREQELRRSLRDKMRK